MLQTGRVSLATSAHFRVVNIALFLIISRSRGPKVRRDYCPINLRYALKI